MEEAQAVPIVLAMDLVEVVDIVAEGFNKTAERGLQFLAGEGKGLSEKLQGTQRQSS